MFNVNNPKFLELAKLDYNRLQNIYSKERQSIMRFDEIFHKFFLHSLMAFQLICVHVCIKMYSIHRWWNGCGFNNPPPKMKICPEAVYFSIAATLYEPEFSLCRMAYAKCNCIEEIIRYLFESHESIEDLKTLCQAVEK